ncbi:hypothetical protein NC652_008878 [Populus alba x Populus x berolinensis]|nr:hypothetical protein NC652_008878 [Populus alba x Populus x berolinensis]
MSRDTDQATLNSIILFYTGLMAYKTCIILETSKQSRPPSTGSRSKPSVVIQEDLQPQHLLMLILTFHQDRSFSRMFVFQNYHCQLLYALMKAGVFRGGFVVW